MKACTIHTHTHIHTYMYILNVQKTPRGLDVFLLGRLGNGCSMFSLSSHVSRVPPRQLPLFGALATEFITRNACVFFMNSNAFGLSCTFPLCLWHPKKRSSGSWHIRWLKNDLTSGKVNRYLTSSTNDLPV